MKEYDIKLSTDYSLTRNHHTATDKVVFSELKKLGLQNKSVLDYGCGDGRYGLKFLSEGSSKVVGVDISQDMINIANKISTQKGSPISFLVADGLSLPFPDNTFDIIFSNFVLHHIFDTPTALTEIKRVLKKDGFFVGTMSTYRVESGSEKLINTVVPICLGEGSDLVKVTNLIKSFDNTKNEIKEAGFRILIYKSISNKDAKIDKSYPEINHVKKMTSLIVAKK